VTEGKKTVAIKTFTFSPVSYCTPFGLERLLLWPKKFQRRRRNFGIALKLKVQHLEKGKDKPHLVGKFTFEWRKKGKRWGIGIKESKRKGKCVS
jgi:hypothetical protein